MVRMGPLQGSYDGSIPFTRSKIEVKTLVRLDIFAHFIIYIYIGNVYKL